MDTDKFLAAYSEPRNGVNQMYRHPLVRNFTYSDGVKECAEAGMYWLLDVVATEALKPLAQTEYFQGVVALKVVGSRAIVELRVEDDAPPIWAKPIEYTDAPEGEWKFLLANGGDAFNMILLSEY